jgi:hydrogenase nickel incorporation protein HypA/HybF
MHEYSIVAALVDRVRHEVAGHPGATARRVRVAIGEFAGVEIELLQRAYDLFREGTACERAELVVDPIAARWSCTRCDRAIASGGVLRCPDCGAPARLGAGGDIILERIEMEVPDV